MTKNTKRIHFAAPRTSNPGEALCGENATGHDVLYQPLVDLETGAVAGFSAQAACGRLRPARPFHGGGLIGLPGRDTSCAQFLCAINQVMDGMSEWMAEEDGPGFILAELDPWGKDHCGEGPLERTPRLLARYGSSASKLTILFNVDSLMERPADAIDLGIGLKRLGVGVGVDNLEPGASPYNFLEMFPADLLRVRFNEIAGFGGEKEIRDWLPELSAFADNLLMEVAVEGVENARQYRLIKSAGCRYAQGGYFSRPLAMEGAREYLRSAGISPYLLGG